MLDTSVRLLRLLSLLQSGRHWSGNDLANRLLVTTRTVRNDIERLRLLGYEVHSSTGTTGGYRLADGATLPPLLLDDDEAVAVAVGLRAAAAGTITGIEYTSLRALAKLEQTLPSRLRHRIDALRSATVSAARRGPTVDPSTLSTIATTIQRHERLRFDYVGHDGEATVRDIEPQRLVYTGHRWYLVAGDIHCADWRTFRADRISPRVPAGPRFTPRPPPDPDIAAHTIRGISSRAWPHPARIRLHAPASFLASLDFAFDVINPPELRDLLSRLAERYAAAARADGCATGSAQAKETPHNSNFYRRDFTSQFPRRSAAVPPTYSNASVRFPQRDRSRRFQTHEATQQADHSLRPGIQPDAGGQRNLTPTSFGSGAS